MFDVAGTIALTSEITIRGSFVTIDGLSAPAAGITLRNAGLIVRGPGHDIVIRGLRIRDARKDGIWVTDGMSNVLIEYVSVHNSADGNIDITRDGTRDVTVAWSVLAEPAGEEKNMLIAFLPTRVSLHHNLFIAAQQRNPQVTFDDSDARSQDTETTLDMRNNLLWNWGAATGRESGTGPAPTSSTTTSPRRAAMPGTRSWSAGGLPTTRRATTTRRTWRARTSAATSAPRASTSTARERRRRPSPARRSIPTTPSSRPATSWPAPGSAPSMCSTRRTWTMSVSPAAHRRLRHPRQGVRGTVR